jgi:hypothetical protein
MADNEKTDQEKKADQEAEEKQKQVTAIEGAEPQNVQNIQDIARKNYENAEKLAQEGKEPPPLPATPVNIAAFQNRENLPEAKRKDLEPRDVQGHPKAEERKKTAEENRATEGKKKGEAFENIPPSGEGSVTDSILADEAKSGGQPTGPAFDAGGRTTAPVKSKGSK